MSVANKKRRLQPRGRRAPHRLSRSARPRGHRLRHARRPTRQALGAHRVPRLRLEPQWPANPGELRSFHAHYLPPMKLAELSPSSYQILDWRSQFWAHYLTSSPTFLLTSITLEQTRPSPSRPAPGRSLTHKRHTHLPPSSTAHSRRRSRCVVLDRVRDLLRSAVCARFRCHRDLARGSEHRPSTVRTRTQSSVVPCTLLARARRSQTEPATAPRTIEN